MKKIIVVILITLFVLHPIPPVFAGSLLTKSSEFSKAAAYGMNFATYTAEKKKGKDAAEKLLLYDVLWDVMGKGEEVLLNGDPAAFSNLKDDILKVQLVLQKVGEVADKLGAGVYDEALISTVDGMVGLVNHPVVNALWEAVKLTYESHKLVVSTKAQLDIETLYGIVNQDRRMMGAVSANKPPLIPVDSETVTYFFNKYLIVNSSVRAMVKSYVQTALGEEFPEISASASAYAYLTGTTEAVQDEYELAQLQEYENNSRRWIKILIEDLNKQVTLRWAETRLEQQRTAFKAFVHQFGSAFGNLDEAFAYYAKVKRLEAEKEQYPARLAELKKKKEDSLAQYAQLQAKDYDKKLGLRGVLFDIARTANVYAVNCMILDDTGLQKSFETLQISCLKQVQVIDDEIVTTEDAVAEELGSAIPDNAPASIFQQYEQSMINTFKPVLDILKNEMPSSSEPPFEKVTSHLSENQFREASEVFSKWKQEEEEQYNAAWQISTEEFGRVMGQKPDYNSSPSLQMKRANPKTKKITAEDIEGAKQERDYYWDQAIQKITKARKALYSIRKQPFLNDSVRLQAMFDYFSNEVSSLRARVDQNLASLTEFYREVFIPGRYGENIQLGVQYTDNGIEWKPGPAYTVEHANQYLQENRYVGIGQIEGVTSIMQISRYIEGRKNEIMAPWRWHQEYIPALSNIDAELYRLDSLRNKWGTFVKLDVETISKYNDLALFTSVKQQNETEMAVHLGKTERDMSSISPWAKISFYDDAVRNMERFISNINTSSIRAQADTYLKSVDTDLNNRDQDYDYLEQLQKEWDRYYQKLVDNQIVARDPQSGSYTVGPGTGLRREEGVGYARVLEPFNHFATMAELENNEKLLAAHNEFLKLRVSTFIQANMPSAYKLLDAFFTAQVFEPAPEENFLIGTAPVWESSLDEAEKIIPLIDIKKDDSYREKMLKLAELLPLKIEFPELTAKNKDEYNAKFLKRRGQLKGTFFEYDFEGFDLGKRYIQLRKEITELLAAKGRLLEQEFSDKMSSVYDLERLHGYQKEFEELTNKVSLLSAKENLQKEEIDSVYATYWDLRTRYFDDTKAGEASFSARLKEYDRTFINLMNGLTEKEDLDRKNIEELYGNFKSAYENKSEYELVDFLSSDWDSGDGTTLTDLEDNFRNMFSVYDAIQYDISNLQVIKRSDKKYNVNYEVLITGEMFDMGIRREEKSSVSEEVILENGQFKINKTLSGRFWYRQ